MRVRQLGRFGLVGLCLAGCGHRVDVAAEKAALLETDRAWAREASAGRDAEKLLAFWTEDARVVMAGEPTRDGKSAIREMITRSLATPGFHIAWTPERADVAASGDVGYTVGTNEITVPDQAGKPMVMAGRYITVWRRDASGQWKCAEDYSTPSAPAKP
jgi:uncharacterized protein (TIGR02246 family)